MIKYEQACFMEFHSDKCKVLRITSKRKIIKYCYLLHNVILKKVPNAMYIRITMNARLSWQKHIHEICVKAKRDNFYKETWQHVSQKQNYNVVKNSCSLLWNTQARYGIQLVIINLRNKLKQYKEKMRNKLQITEIISDWNWIGTHHHLLRKRTLNYLTKLAKLTFTK